MPVALALWDMAPLEARAEKWSGWVSVAAAHVAEAMLTKPAGMGTLGLDKLDGQGDGTTEATSESSEERL